MRAGRIRESCRQSFVLVTRCGEDIKLEPLFPEDHPVTEGLIGEVRRHKPELLALLKWEEQADAHLLESTGRISAAWMPGQDLDSREWQAYEKAITDAHRNEDLDDLIDVLAKREAYALRALQTHKSEVKP